MKPFESFQTHAHRLKAREQITLLEDRDKDKLEQWRELAGEFFGDLEQS